MAAGARRMARDPPRSGARGRCATPRRSPWTTRVSRTAQIVGPSMLSLDGDAHARPPRAVRGAVPADAGPRTLRRGRDDRGRPPASTPSRPPAQPSSAASSPVRSRRRSWRGRSGSTRTRSDAMLTLVRRDRCRGDRGHGRRRRPQRGRDAFDSLRERLESVIRDSTPASRCSPPPRRDADLTTDQIVSNAASCCSAASRRPRG